MSALAIELLGVSKWFASAGDPTASIRRVPEQHRVLDNINFSVRQGEFVFLLGASGAGKTTLMKLLYGAERANQGELVVCGMRMPAAGAAPASVALAELRRSVSVVYQDFKLMPSLSVLDNVAMVLMLRGIHKEVARESAWALLRSVGLIGRVDDFPSVLSGGEQQRVALARALIGHPKVILADEPTGNLDRGYSRKVFDLLVEAHAAGVTLIVATHHLQMVEELGFRAIVLESGAIVRDSGGKRSAVLGDVMGL